MKKVKYLSLLLLPLLFIACTPDDEKGQVAYSGDALLNFTGNTTKQVFVFTGSGFSELEIPYGVLKPVSGSNTVTLVPDVENSTAVLGVDYEIVTGTDELAEGETNGFFKIKLLEEPATQDGKAIVFKLESATLSSAVFNNTYRVNVSLTCPVETFVGDFDSDTWWAGPSTNTISFVPEVENTLQIEGFWGDNPEQPNLIFTYDPNTFVVTIPDSPGVPAGQGQNTGYVGAQGTIYAKPTAAKVSSFNPCTRVLTLYITYWIPGVGTYPDQVEVFTGI